MTRFKSFSDHTMLDDYQLAVVDKEHFFSTYKENLFEHYPPELNFWIGRLNDGNQEQSAKSVDEDFIFIKHNDEPIAAFWGISYPDGNYFIELVVVHEAYRRKRIYTMLMQQYIIDAVRNDKHEKMTICHSPNNNQVIIANLKLGFNVTSLNIDPACGPILTLTYYLNRNLFDAYTFRCNGITVTKPLLENCLQKNRFRNHLNSVWPE